MDSDLPGCLAALLLLLLIVAAVDLVVGYI